MVEAAEEKEEQEQRTLAWVIVSIVNGVGMRTRPARIEDYLPRKGPRSLEEYKAELEQKRKRFEAARERRIKELKLGAVPDSPRSDSSAAS